MDAITLRPRLSRQFLLPSPTVTCAAMHNRKRRHLIRSVLADNHSTKALSVDRSRTVYNDSWFDRLAINYLSRSLQATIGEKSENSGYVGLVETATAISRRFNPIQQREVVLQALDSAFPKPLLSLIKALLPTLSRFEREICAAFTIVFFAWLVGPCEVRESEFRGRKEKNVVHIPKCRFLEETKCVGMCTNLCKMSCQSFIHQSLGVPVTMVPNFEEMSCEIVFGEEPPPESLDLAFKHPCFTQCNVKRAHRAGNCGG